VNATKHDNAFSLVDYVWSQW